MIALVMWLLLALQAADDWPPLPDFEAKVDYVGWVRERVRGTFEQSENAYELYRKIFPEVVGAPLKPVSHLYFTGFRQTWDPPLAPRPWDPRAERTSNWEQSYQRTKATLETFRQAAARPYYLFPVLAPGEPPWVRERLASQRIPYVAFILSCVEGLSEAAWRMSDGRIDPAAFLDTCETRLRAARQLERDPTIVAIGAARRARMLVYEDLRYALHYDLFGVSERSQAAELLRHEDSPLPRFGERLRGECARLLDYVQGVTRSRATEGYAIDPDSFRRLEQVVFTIPPIVPPPETTPEELTSTDPKDAAEAILEHYRGLFDLAQKGYPRVTHTEIAALEERFARAHPFGRRLMTGTAGLHLLRTGAVAERRATHLLYAIHMFRDQNGRWPKELGELPEAVASEFATDPFTDRAFIYRVEAGNPILYTAGANCKDDGGAHNARWNRPGGPPSETPGGDGVFWPIRSGR